MRTILDAGLNIGNEPYLISLGNHVILASNCNFITHDYSTACVSQYIGKNVGKIGAIKIDDNTFIGANATIMPGTHIGKNCIVAAGSVVTKDIPDGEVWGGYQLNLLLQWKNIVKRFLQLMKDIHGTGFRVLIPYRLDKSSFIKKITTKIILILNKEYMA